MAHRYERLVSWQTLATELFCAIMVIVTYHECKGESILLQGLQNHKEKREASIKSEASIGYQKQVIPLPLDKADDLRDVLPQLDPSQNIADVTFTNQTHIISQTTEALITKLVTTTTTATPATTTTATTTTSTPATTTTAATTTTLVTTKSTTVESTASPTMPMTMYTTVKTTTPIIETTQNGDMGTTPPSPDQDALVTNFGEYGLVAFAVTLGIAVLLLYILLMVICVPKCRKAKKEMKLNRMKNRTENLSDMRSPAAIYRPPPSLKRGSCVPTPLAMIPADDVVSLTATNPDKDNNSSSRVVPSTDFDSTSDPDVMDGNGTAAGAVDYSIDKPFPTLDRKFSTISTTDTTNVSSFLLRQTSVKQEEEKRKQSIAGNN